MEKEPLNPADEKRIMFEFAKKKALKELESMTLENAGHFLLSTGNHEKITTTSYGCSQWLAQVLLNVTDELTNPQQPKEN